MQATIRYDVGAADKKERKKLKKEKRRQLKMLKREGNIETRNAS